MINKKKLFTKKAGMSYFQICVLIVASFAFAYLISGNADKVNIAKDSENDANFISLFFISFLKQLTKPVLNIVSAEEITSNVCCEKTTYGAWCQNAPSSQCASGFLQSPTSCDATSYCRQGCCYDSSEGICSENTPQKVCNQNNGTWQDDASCNIAQCNYGCCVLGQQAAFVTLTRCKKLSSFYGLQTNFLQNINNEVDCIAIAQSQDKGACVYEVDFTKTCRFTTRENCKTGVSNETGQITGTYTFHKDYLCSSEELGTPCAPTKQTTCVAGKDEVYSVDNCGNPANIYDASKINDKSYWNKIISKTDSCGAGNTNGNANSPSCGNCDYFSGSFCKLSKSATYGNNICSDLSCKNTYDGNDYRNGESWCVDDKDMSSVGARAFRHICANGEEILEPCADFKQETCIEDSISTSKGTFSQAACRANMWQECLAQKEKIDCENTDKRDCSWILVSGGLQAVQGEKATASGLPAVVNPNVQPPSVTGQAITGYASSENEELAKKGVCVPKISPGLKFYSEGEATGICSQANSQCIVTFEKGISGKETCVSNCECLSASWKNERNKLCSALGDCGSKLNYIGLKSAKDNIKITKKEVEITEKLFLPLLKLSSYVLFGDVDVGKAYNDGDTKVIGGKTFTRTTKDDETWWTASGETTSYTDDGIQKLNLAEPGSGAKAPEGLAMITQNVIFGNLLWGLGIGTAAALIASMLGKPNSNAGTAAFFAGLAGATTQGILYSGWTGQMLLGKEAFFTGTEGVGAFLAEGGIAWPASNAFWWSTGIGIAVAIVVFAMLYKETNQQIVSFVCYPWEAPLGGASCEKCNQDDMKPCSEYRCKSLGQACQIVNAGTKQEACVWVNRNDVKSPGISPWTEPLTKGYVYTDIRIRPPGGGSQPGGYKITKTGGGCVKAFEPLSFGISTYGPDNIAEPAQCKIDYNHTLKFDDMKYYFGNSNLYSYNHSQVLSLPSPAEIEKVAPELVNNGEFTLYVRCRDANGNENTDEFAIRFCVDAGEDTTAPVIEATSIINGMPVQFGLNETSLDVYVNEPAECSWSRLDKSYENMETKMTCQAKIYEMNNNMLYKCTTTLNGLKNNADNDYYFRCRDKTGNANQESYRFTLKGTQLLNILSASPNNETIKGYSTFVPVTLKAETANGYSQGDAICYYSQSKDESSYIKFYLTETNKHEQRQDLSAGSYKYYLKCIDLGGNTAYTNISFSVEVDQQAPEVVRVYNEPGVARICGSYGCLKIVTNEKSSCSYSTKDCNFAISDGIEMPYNNTESHYAEWKTDRIYYVRCSDASGNEPIPNRCSIIVKGYEKS